MIYKTNPWPIVLTVLITALVAGGGVYYWQTKVVSQGERIIVDVDSAVACVPQFKTIEEYRKLTDTLSLQPQGLARVQIDSKDLSIAPEGVDFYDAYVWASPDWDKKNIEDVQTFYVETIKFDLSKEKEGVDISETAYSTWYGPFQGKLGRLLK